jgi:hypothetical protein
MIVYQIDRFEGNLLTNGTEQPLDSSCRAATGV